MGRRVAVLLAVIAAAACLPGEALASIPIRVPKIPVKPPAQLHIPTVRPGEIAAARAAESRFGTGFPEVENRLQGASDDAAEAIDGDIARMGRTAEVRARLRECVVSGLESTAQAYGQAMLAEFTGVPSDFPGVAESLRSAAYSCIGDQISVRSDLLEETATYLSRRIHASFEVAAAATDSGAAEQRWLQVTAVQIAASGTDSDGTATDSFTQASEPPPPPPPDSDDSPGFLPWLGGAALLLGVVLVVWRPWRTS
jgi:hypothetical protein